MLTVSATDRGLLGDRLLVVVALQCLQWQSIKHAVLLFRNMKNCVFKKSKGPTMTADGKAVFSFSYSSSSLTYLQSHLTLVFTACKACIGAIVIVIGFPLLLLLLYSMLNKALYAPLQSTDTEIKCSFCWVSLHCFCSHHKITTAYSIKNIYFCFPFLFILHKIKCNFKCTLCTDSFDATKIFFSIKKCQIKDWLQCVS